MTGSAGRACVFDAYTGEGCPHPPAYSILTEHSEDPWLACVDHTAEMRGNDPLGYIVSVRSLRPLGRVS